MGFTRRYEIGCGSVRALVGCFVLLFVPMSLFAQPSAGWPARIKALADSGRLDQAMAVTDEWMRAFPQDLDAKSWHARLLAWSHYWPEAETEYRALLDRSPENSDLLLDLAHLLMWQKRYVESLHAVDDACKASPDRPDCDLERARVLRRLGRTKEARAEYKTVLEKGIAVEESKAALEALTQAASHELRVGGTADLMSYTDNAGSAEVSLQSRWNERWRSAGALTRYSRFRQMATAFEGSVTYRLTGADALTLGGGTAGDQAIVPRAQAQLEYGHGFHLPPQGFLRGVEATYQQRWLWYRGARVLGSAPAAILYLPKDWNWLVRLSINRLDLAGASRSWKPSALTRLTFPIRRGLTGHVLVATGTENLGTVEQLLWSRTRTAGGGLRIRVAHRQELIMFVQYQHLAPGRSQTGVGVAYAFRL